MTKLQNLMNRTQVFNLETSAFLEMEGENGKGEPETLTLLPRETKEVHDAALQCIEIKAALRPKHTRAQPTLRVVK